MKPIRATSHPFVLFAVLISACQSDLTGPHSGSARWVPGQAKAAFIGTSALGPNADTYVKGGTPNMNQGLEPSLRVQQSGNNRILISFPQSSIASIVGQAHLQSAILRLTISSNAGNWGTTGRAIGLYRVTTPWTESAATRNCAIDANLANSSPDCSGATKWTMDGPLPRPWDTTATATAVITSPETGTVDLDVTPDINAYLSGAKSNLGWILKKVDEGAAGQVEFSSREAAAGGPTLILNVAPVGPLVLYYPFDGNANDASGNGSDGIATNAEYVADRFGHPSAALHVPSNNTGITTSIPGTGIAFPTSGTFSFATWVKVDSLPRGPNNAVIFTAGQSEVSWGFQVRPDGMGFATICTPTEFCFSTTASGGSARAVPLSIGTWVHLAATYDGPSGTLKYFQDGQWTGTVTMSLSARATDTRMYIGTQGNATDFWFAGAIDEFRIYSRLLSDAEIAQLSETGTCLPSGARFSDDFSGSSIGSAWTQIGGGWSQSGGTLSGSDFDAQSDQGNLLLSPSLYDTTSYIATFTLDASRPEGKLVTYVGSGNKYNFNFGYGAFVQAPGNGYVNAEYRTGGNYSNALYQRSAPQYKGSGTDTITVRKQGSRYRLIVNGAAAADFIDTIFNGAGQLGIGAYGTMDYDFIAVCDLP